MRARSIRIPITDFCAMLLVAGGATLLAAGCTTPNPSVTLSSDGASEPGDLGVASDLAAPCKSGWQLCGATCVDLQTANDHCGSCQAACPVGDVCSNGHCGKSCQLPLVLCDTSCVDPRVDVANCGGCGAACPPIAGGSASCVAGRCGVGACNAGLADCDGKSANGCETNLGSDVQSCGHCGAACPAVASGTAACTLGTCGIGTCSKPFADCDHDATNGCETNLSVDSKNCGACGTSCPTGQVCSNGSCAAVCAAPVVLCGSACVDTSSDPKNCGGCGHGCTDPPNASSGCASSACTLGMCYPSYGDCDHVAANGCETDLLHDLKNCGACGNACSPVANGTVICDFHCILSGCTTGFSLCGASCVDLKSDAQNCGACAKICAFGKQCNAGGCVCAAGLTDCSGPCIDLQSDGANCGACGAACAAGQSCQHGTCVTQCSGSFTNCGNMCVDLQFDPMHCGGCNTVCPTGASCSMGVCSWSKQPSGLSSMASLTGVWGSGPSDVYVVGQDTGGVILHTVDHGGTWTARGGALPASPTAIWGSGPSDIYVVGLAGMILHSTDGGITWPSALSMPGTVFFGI